jgi:Ca2+/Na+ antiporter
MDKEVVVLGRKGYRRRSYGRKTKAKISGLEMIFFFIVVVFVILYQVLLAIARFLDRIIIRVEAMTFIEWINVAVAFMILSYVTFVLWKFRRNRKIKIAEEEQRQLFEERKRTVLRDGIQTKLKTMASRDFEHYVAELFRCIGYHAEVTPISGDGGKDVILRKEGELALVECKRYTRPRVTRPDIQKFHSALVDQNANKGFYVTTGVFTKPAIEYVNDKPIELIDMTKLLDMIEEIKNI